ncbi:unnamed protein product, partial [marine sediment metagenome]
MSIEKDGYIREYLKDISRSKFVVEAVILLYKNNGNCRLMLLFAFCCFNIYV